MILAEQVNGLMYVMVALAVMGVLLMLRNIRRGGGNVTTAPKRRLRPVPHERGHHLDAPEDFRKWEVELHTLGREISARIDNKISILQSLIQSAEQQATRLEQAIAAAVTTDSAVKTLAKPVAPGEEEPKS